MRSSLLLLFILISIIGKAQAPVMLSPMVFSNITEQNGLSDDHVQCVLMDHEGLVWIGTADGLNLIDGSTIRIFHHRDEDSNSVAGNIIYCLAEDGDGNIWIGTNQGISRYNRKSQDFFSVSPPTSPYGASSVITGLVIGGNNMLWCATDGGLYSFDRGNHAFQPYYNTTADHHNNIALSNRLHSIIKDSGNLLWICSADGLWTFEPRDFRYNKEIYPENDPKYHGLFLSVFEDHLHNIWAGDWQYGLKRLDRNTHHVDNFMNLPDHPDNVRSIIELQESGGKYVLLLDGPLLGFDPSQNKFFHFPKPLHYFSSPEVSPCYHSNNGWIWMGGEQGLFIYNPTRQIFHHLTFPQEQTSQGIVFAEWKNCILIGGEAKNFLKAYDTDWNTKKDFSSLFNNKKIPNGPGSVLSLSIGKENDLWLSSTAGIGHVNLLDGNLSWFSHKEGDSSTIPRNFISHLFMDSKNRLWVFPWREGIWQMDPETGKCKKLIGGFTQEADHIKGLLIADATEDKDGNIWMADLDEGIVLFDQKNQSFSKPFTKEIGERVHTSRVYYRNGFCYSSTPQFIFRWDPSERKLQIFRPPVEINKSIYDMIPDADGRWWLATRNGLAVFDEKLNTYNQFTITDGLLSNDMNGELYKRQDGSMVFGMPDYFTIFHPADFSASSENARKVLLTALSVNEKPTELDSAGKLDIDYHSTNLRFQWALPDYSNPLRNQYYSMLEGIDSGWKYDGNKGEIQYANLSTGSYQLFLKAASSNGTESANILRIRFEIHPPYWKTAWFRALVLLVVGTLFFIIIRYVSQRNLKEKLLLLEKEQAVEKERNRISRDMHDDLGSGLTKIAIMSEVVKKQMNEPEKARQQLDNISESSRELVDNLQDIIWILNPRNDTLESLAAYIREYALKFFEPFGIEARFDYPEKFADLKLSEETRRNIFLVIKESFNNIGKYAWCNRVNLAISQKPREIIISITDDGRGFDAGNTRQFGNGLINMANRIEQVGGNYDIDSSLGEGTKTKIRIPV